MQSRQRRFHGIAAYLSIHWLRFAGLYAVALLALAGIVWSVQRGWVGLTFLSSALFLAALFFFSAGIWGANRLFGQTGLQPLEALVKMGQMKPTANIAAIDLGLRQGAMRVVRVLTTGELVVVDVYNPQLVPSRTILRAREQAPSPVADPRLIWRDGRLTLLPLPDDSVSAVFVDQILSAFWQEGDRKRLLREIHRILEPNGRLLVAERLNTRINQLTLGVAASKLKSADYWQNLLTSTGFKFQVSKDLDGLILCMRVDKPVPHSGTQLSLGL